MEREIANNIMLLAIDLAEKNRGRTGGHICQAVVVTENHKVIYQKSILDKNQYHQSCDEIKQLSIGRAGLEMYFTVEPEYFELNQIQHVWIGIKNPDKALKGQGILKIKEKGIPVTVGVQEKELQYLNRYEIKYLTTNLPYLLMNVGVSLDGRIATHTGDSQWISCPESLEFVHGIRNRVKGIMVGIGTILADNPSLTTRLAGVENTRNPQRIILDSKGRIPLEAKVLEYNKDGSNMIITTEQVSHEKVKALEELGTKVIICPGYKISFQHFLRELGKEGIDSILLEGGSTVNWSALYEKAIDEAMFCIAPKIVGGRNSFSSIGGDGFAKISEVATLEDMKVRQIGKDILLYGQLQYHHNTLRER